MPAICAAGAFLLLLAALLWYPPLWQRGYQVNSQPFAVFESGETVNVNTAGASQLCLLPGIGDAKAQAIIVYREENGPFYVLEDLGNVPGIGSGLLEKLEGLVSF